MQDCRENLDELRGRLQKEETRLQEQEQALRKNQEEHRLAMVAFRQQMIGWQGQITDLKRLLASDETRLERRHALVQEQAKEIDAASEKLAQEGRGAASWSSKKSPASARRWTATSATCASGTAASSASWPAWTWPEAGNEAEEQDVVPLPNARDAAPLEDHDDQPGDEDEALIPTGRNILSLTDPVDPGDRKLGDLLIELELIDARLAHGTPGRGAPAAPLPAPGAAGGRRRHPLPALAHRGGQPGRA